MGASNNTVVCEVNIGGKNYTAAKEFTFAP